MSILGRGNREAVQNAVRRDEAARRNDNVIRDQHKAARTQARRLAHQTTQNLNHR